MKGDCAEDQVFPVLLVKQFNKPSCFGLKKDMIVFQFIAESKPRQWPGIPRVYSIGVCGKLGEEVMLL
jgi:hypothetical protein